MVVVERRQKIIVMLLGFGKKWIWIMVEFLNSNIYWSRKPSQGKHFLCDTCHLLDHLLEFILANSILHKMLHASVCNAPSRASKLIMAICLWWLWWVPEVAGGASCSLALTASTKLHHLSVQLSIFYRRSSVIYF